MIKYFHRLKKVGKYMKHFIAVILALSLVFSFSACGNQNDPLSESPSTDIFSTDTAGDETETTEEVTQQEENTESTDATSSETVPSESVSQPDDEKKPKPESGEVISTTPDNDDTKECSHDYKITTSVESTCTTDGRKTYTCTKCQKQYTQLLKPIDHDYKDATCTAPKTCSVCSATTGNELGHSFGSYGKCVRCDKLSGPIQFKATVRSTSGSKPISGVTVHVYTDVSGNTPAASAITDNKGSVQITLPGTSNKYKVVLSDVPSDYEAKESYSFTSTNVNINLKVRPVLDPSDHSKAMYQVGDTMADFTLTDTDGKTHKLSSLLKEKDLIILDFWYVNCNPCKSEFPYFNAALDQYGKDIALLALTPYDSESSIQALREEIEINFPTIRDTIGLSAGFNVSAFPTTVFIDNTGKILAIHRGQYASQQAFFKDINKYI